MSVKQSRQKPREKGEDGTLKRGINITKIKGPCFENHRSFKSKWQL